MVESNLLQIDLTRYNSGIKWGWVMSMRSICLGSLTFAAFVMPLTAQRTTPYPDTPVKSVVETIHGVEVEDPYRWLEDAEDPDVMAWTQAQNAFTQDYLHSLPLLARLRDRFQELESYDTTWTWEVAVGPTHFSWVKGAKDEYWKLCVQAEENAPRTVLLDPNSWTTGETLEFATPSPDGRYVAYGLACAGDEQAVVSILDLSTGKRLSDSLYGRRQGWPHSQVVWHPDSTGFYYGANPQVGEVSAEDSAYWQAIYYHRLGTQGTFDTRIFGHDTVREYLHEVAVSDDGNWLVLQRHNGVGGSEVFLARAEQPGNLIPLSMGFKAHFQTTFAGNQLILLSDEGASNGRVYRIDPKQPEQVAWVEVLPEADDQLAAIAPIGGRLYATYLHKATSRIRMFDLQGSFLGEVPLESLGTAQVSGSWRKESAWIDCATFVQPSIRYRYSPSQGILAQVEAPQMGIDAQDYLVEQVWYTSHDGTPISMFLIQKRKEGVQVPRPTLLSGYGGFGISVTPNYTSLYVPFLEAGGVVAIPNLRGGGEYGDSWHQAGCKARKQNVFDDFISAAEWLIEQGITTSQQLAIRGRSNGGLLVGAALTQRPELFRAVLCDVPLLDMIRYHRFGFSNIWAIEYGSAEDPDQFAYLLKYSPYHCVRGSVQYPAVLIRGAENDARTDALHARKMIAKLQKADPAGLPHLLLVDPSAGHLGAATISKQIDQSAIALAFVMSQLGLRPVD